MATIDGEVFPIQKQDNAIEKVITAEKLGNVVLKEKILPFLGVFSEQN